MTTNSAPALQTPGEPSVPGRHRVWGFVGAVLGARLVYLFWFCPYDLVEDEASYWEWSRHLDLSYYTKGPGIALAVRAATELLGTSEAAIRTVAALSGAVAALAVATLAGLAAAFPSPGRFSSSFGAPAALYAAAIFTLCPIFQATSIFATIDGPYVACWALAALFAFLALERSSRWAWPALGLALGVGFLFKYTILLLIPGLLLHTFAHRRRLSLTPRWPLLLLATVTIFGAGLAPVVYWNASHDWPTLAHLLGHVGVRGGDMPLSHRPYNPAWTLSFLGVQLGAVGPALILSIVAAIATLRARDPDNPSRDARGRSSHPLSPDPRRPARLFLIACAVPILLFYFAISFFTEPEGNWAMGGYVTLLALAGWTVAEALPHYRTKVAAWRALPTPRPHMGILFRKPETTPQVLWHFTLAYGIITALGLIRMDLLAGAISPGNPGRAASLTGASVLGRHAYGYAYQLKRETDLEPFYVAQHYGRAAILAFYVPDQPAVRCTSSRMGGRPTQYDFWPDRSLDDPSLLGRPAVLSGATLQQWAPLFERVEPVPNGRLNGEHKKDRLAFLGYGYKGSPERAGAAKGGK
jgi:hypothetical protein